MNRPRRAVVLVPALLLAAGCGGTSGTSTAHHTASATPSTTPTSLSAEAAIHRIALVQSDLPTGYGPNRMRAGDVVAGQVTMDLCGATFPSEGLRIARHQVSFPLRATQQSVGNEVVAYQPGGAAQAMRELRAAIANCPSGYAKSKVAGVPALKTTIRVLPSQPGWQPRTLAIAIAISARDGSHFAATGIFQPHDDVLSILYLEGAGPLRLTSSLSTLLSRRLDAVTIGNGV